jgi:hypothetical protein
VHGPVGAGAGQKVTDSTDYKTYFGDLHNHGNVGYAQGSLRRAFEIAREHLDFFAHTPHAHWHDMGTYEANIQDRWTNGFAVTRARWPEVLDLNRRFDAPGRFVTIPGYEWHSSSVGDYHVLFPTLDAELGLFDHLTELQDFVRKRGCLMVPHHPANLRGHRGANLALRDPALSPVLEMYSEWGSAESDRGPFPYIRHSHGGRWTRNTLQYFLEEGHRLGVIASTDDHYGFPGAYRQGLAAVKTRELTRDGIFDALRNRRCYAVTGDRILLDFSIDGRMMGQEIPYSPERAIRVVVTGWDAIDRVEVLKNNRVIHRDFPVDRSPGWKNGPEPVLVRVEYGWGPWPALGMTRAVDWDLAVSLQDAVIEDVQPCFQSGPLEEDRRDQILERSKSRVRLKSFTARRQLMDDVATKAVVLRMRGGPKARLSLDLQAPSRRSLSKSFEELAVSSEVLYTGDFPRESALVHRLVFGGHSQTSFDVADRDEGKSVNWYYVRVTQANGQIAWSSPIWVEPRGA